MIGFSLQTNPASKKNKTTKFTKHKKNKHRLTRSELQVGFHQRLNFSKANAPGVPPDEAETQRASQGLLWRAGVCL